MKEEISYDRYIFAANLKRLMERSGEKQADIARMLGVSKATVSAYCSASQMPRMDKIEQLSRHFDVLEQQCGLPHATGAEYGIQPSLPFDAGMQISHEISRSVT